MDTFLIRFRYTTRYLLDDFAFSYPVIHCRSCDNIYQQVLAMDLEIGHSRGFETPSSAKV